MTSPSFSVRRPGAANLSIRPPSPSHQPPPAIVTPQNQIQSPRPVIPSPTHSNRSSSTGAGGGAGGNDHPRRGSFETSRSGDAPSRRGQLPPWIGNLSPSRRGESKGGYAGAYDNKLVSSLLPICLGRPVADVHRSHRLSPTSLRYRPYHRHSPEPPSPTHIALQLQGQATTQIIFIHIPFPPVGQIQHSRRLRILVQSSYYPTVRSCRVLVPVRMQKEGLSPRRWHIRVRTLHGMY